MNKVFTYLAERAPIKALSKWAQNIKPWGFEGLSLFQVAKFFMEGIFKGALTMRAAAISFRLFLAVFPVVLMLLALLPLVPIPNFQADLLSNIGSFFPGTTFDYFESVFFDLIAVEHNDILSIGFVLSLIYASNSINAILMGFNSSYNLEMKGNWLIIRGVSILLMIGLSLILVIAVSLIIFSGLVFDKLIEMNVLQSSWVFLLDVARYVISLLLIYLTITILYNIGDQKTKKWKWLSAGAWFTTLLIIVTSSIFAWFVESVNTYNNLYGSLGSFLVLLIWVNFNCTILLLGFELNTSIKRAGAQLNKV